MSAAPLNQEPRFVEVSPLEAATLLIRHTWIRRKTCFGVLYQDPSHSSVIAIDEKGKFKVAAEYLNEIKCQARQSG